MVTRLVENIKARQGKDPKMLRITVEEFHSTRIFLADIRITVRIDIVQIDLIDTPGIEEGQQAQPGNQRRRGDLLLQLQIEQHHTGTGDQCHIEPPFGDPVVTRSQDLLLFRRYIRV